LAWGLGMTWDLYSSSQEINAFTMPHYPQKCKNRKVMQNGEPGAGKMKVEVVFLLQTFFVFSKLFLG